MRIIKLQSQLQSEIQTATEVCIASAIVSDAGLEYLLNSITIDCKVRMLIGIDLPTPDSVFKTIMELTNTNIEVKVFTKQGFFHPKLYLVNGNSKTVFIGSGNFTEGGLDKNIELFHKISDDDLFADYQNWFNQYFNLGTALTDNWVKEYSLLWNERYEWEANDKKKVGNFKRRLSGKKAIPDLKKINFTFQFFKLHHHLAFEGNKPNLQTVAAINERFVVGERLMELHDLVFPLIKSKGWDLHPHSMTQHIVSSFKHGDYTSESLDALWLHYGRSQHELNKFKNLYGANQSSLYHMRLQVLVHLNDVSVWLRVGKNNGSIIDREQFKIKMNEQDYKNKFFTLLTSLPDDFFISINAEWRGVKSFENEIDLHNFVKQDDIRNYYFIIGKEYLPDAVEVSQINIANTVINDFEKLLPLYIHIKTNI
jgi:HKD family nuclease